MLKNILLLLLLFCSNSYIYASIEKYTISVCATSNLENALTCKKRILKDMQSDVFIVKEKNGKFITYLGVYENKSQAKLVLNIASDYVKEQKSFIKILETNVIALKAENNTYIDLNIHPTEIKVENEQNSEVNNQENKEELKLVFIYPKVEELKLVQTYPYSEGQVLVDDVPQAPEDKITISKEEEYNKSSTDEDEKIVYSENELKYSEELKTTSMDEFDKSVEKQEEQKVEKKVEQKVENIPEKVQNTVFSISDYEEILIEVDSVNNFMTVRAKIDNEFKDIKTYRVSTGKDDVKKPFGIGKITQISLNPTWYPTADTISSFKKRGINLPSVVPSGSKFNYMGAAKINLTHKVDGKNTFRIHGTLNEKTIGTNESAGCIRMKNNEVVQLATMLNQFASYKSLDDVKVFLK